MVHVLVTGGVRSGKSRHAESLLATSAPVSYLTPGYPADPAHDAEWAARVAAHRLRRPPAWRTVETLDLATAVAGADGPVLIDCLGTWLTRLLDAWQGWDDEEIAWAPRLAGETAALADAVRSHPADVVVVTNEVGWGLVSEYRAGRLFADHLGRVNQAVAAACDQVVLMVAGRPVVL
ncbi:MAG: bifunctional adenosylcobinamide kinase/adenosylcobinamide-phosphate guanylyltransferase [Actinobacteria bacterium HGW-Actinobacteria-5]|nr:MAG: bifunctional adenosylcobinamide kinase/adenosylcobinamide-phosphate guanylyltransferase [Actinobacteria bacterium HGW-Actinobacteria-5]